MKNVEAYKIKSAPWGADLLDTNLDIDSKILSNFPLPKIMVCFIYCIPEVNFF